MTNIEKSIIKDILEKYCWRYDSSVCKLYLDEERLQELTSLFAQQRAEIVKEAITTLTEDISQTSFVDTGKKQWEYKNNRGIEPCSECNNRSTIVRYLDSLTSSPSTPGTEDCEMHPRSFHKDIPSDARCSHCLPDQKGDTT